MKKQLRFKKFCITELDDGRFKIVYNSCFGKYESIEKNFNDAAMFVWNIADNHDIGNDVNHKMCDTWNRVIWDDFSD